MSHTFEQFCVPLLCGAKSYANGAIAQFHSFYCNNSAFFFVLCTAALSFSPIVLRLLLNFHRLLPPLFSVFLMHNHSSCARNAALNCMCYLDIVCSSMYNMRRRIDEKSRVFYTHAVLLLCR